MVAGFECPAVRLGSASADDHWRCVGRPQPEWIALARQLMNAPDDYPESPGDVALADQVRAAARQNKVLFREDMAAIQRNEPFMWSDGRIDGEMRVIMFAHSLKIVNGLANGEIRHCRHVSAYRPVPCFAPVFGSVVLCRPCFFRDPPREQLDPDEDIRCDACDVVIRKGIIHQITCAAGPLTLIAGACSACMTSCGWMPPALRRKAS